MSNAINILKYFPVFCWKLLESATTRSANKKTSKFGIAMKWFLIQLLRFVQSEGFHAFKVSVFVTHCQDFRGTSTQSEVGCSPDLKIAYSTNGSKQSELSTVD